jgi:hypothetical protein
VCVRVGGWVGGWVVVVVVVVVAAAAVVVSVHETVTCCVWCARMQLILSNRSGIIKPLYLQGHLHSKPARVRCPRCAYEQIVHLHTCTRIKVRISTC